MMTWWDSWANRHIRENKVILRVREGSGQRSRLQAHSDSRIFYFPWRMGSNLPNNHERVLRALTASSMLIAQSTQSSVVVGPSLASFKFIHSWVPPPKHERKKSWVLSFSTTAFNLEQLSCVSSPASVTLKGNRRVILVLNQWQVSHVGQRTPSALLLESNFKYIIAAILCVHWQRVPGISDSDV